MEHTVNRFSCLPGSTLKIIAVIAMAIDHFAASIIYHGILLPAAPISPDTTIWTIYQIYEVMRFIGRIAFPIFCFLLVEGFLYTSNKRKYAVRLFLFALVSEFPFDLAIFDTFITWEYQNVYFTLCIGLLTIWLMDIVKSNSIAIPLQMVIVFAGCLLAYALHTDYDYKGILLIAILYVFHNNRSLMTAAGIVSLLWEAPACLAFIPINMYNGKRGLSLKYFFYLFYPVHLLVFGLLLHFTF